MAARCSQAGPAALVEIASGAVVNGGLALVGDGIVDIAGSSGESVKFLSTWQRRARTRRRGPTAPISGKVSGFGGSGHSNHDQFIDFAAIGGGASVKLHVGQPATPAAR